MGSLNIGIFLTRIPRKACYRELKH